MVSFVRRARDAGDFVLVVCNFTPVARHAYRVGVPWPGYYRELINSDAGEYGGSNLGKRGWRVGRAETVAGTAALARAHVAPLAVLVLKPLVTAKAATKGEMYEPFRCVRCSAVALCAA